MKNSVTFTGNTTAKICDVHAPRGRDFFVGTILAKFAGASSGTAAIYLTDDNGVTLIPLSSQFGGTAITATANGMQLVNFGFPSSNRDSLQIWAGVTGFTGTGITVSVYDNR